jgi:hypothetical protein
MVSQKMACCFIHNQLVLWMLSVRLMNLSITKLKHYNHETTALWRIHLFAQCCCQTINERHVPDGTAVQTGTVLRYSWWFTNTDSAVVSFWRFNNVSRDVYIKHKIFSVITFTSFVRSEVLPAVKVSIFVFWVVTPCGLVDTNVS